MPELTPAADRFFAKVQKTDDCWIWTGAACHLGYGRFKVRSYTPVGAHRWSYEHHVGPIPAGYQIDHLCRVPSCVNPAHLEAVTPQINTGRIPRSSHCVNGHEFTPENTLIRGLRQRRCRACDRNRAREARRRRSLLDA